MPKGSNSKLPDHGVDGGDEGVSLSVEDVEDVGVESGAHHTHTRQQGPHRGQLVLSPGQVSNRLIVSCKQ